MSGSDRDDTTCIPRDTYVSARRAANFGEASIMSQQPFEQLKVWQRSMDLVDVIYKLTRGFPADEKSSMTASLRRGSTAVPLQIAAAHESDDPNDYNDALRQAKRGLRDMHTTLLIARRLRYASRWRLGRVQRRIMKLVALIDQQLEAHEQSQIVARISRDNASSNVQRRAA